MSRSQTHFDEVVGACTEDPDRWTAGIDEAAKAVCRGCPRRWLCARQACEMPGAEGMWAGVFIPQAGRGRDHAFRQLRSLAERGGYPARKPAIPSSAHLERENIA